MAPNNPTGNPNGKGHEVQVARISARGAIISALIAAVTAVMVAVIGVRFAPSGISQAIVPNAAVTHTATATVTVTATPVTTVTVAAPSAPTPAATVTTGTKNGVALTISEAVSHQDCYVASRGQNAWYDQSVSLDSSGAQLQAVTCRINWTGAATGYMDYLVPVNAQELSVQVGIDRKSPNTTAQVRFDVLSVDGTKLTSATATYQNPESIKVAVTGGTRVRLKVTMVRSTEEINSNNFVRVAWASPVFT